MKNDFATIYDGTDLEVSYRPQAGLVASGADAAVDTKGQERKPNEVIKVRKCPAFDIAKLAAKWGKEMEEVVFYTGRDEKWAQSISDESYEAVLEEGRRLNIPSVTKYFKRAKGTLDALGQGEKLEQATERLVAKAAEQLASAASQ